MYMFIKDSTTAADKWRATGGEENKRKQGSMGLSGREVTLTDLYFWFTRILSTHIDKTLFLEIFVNRSYS